MGPFAPYCERRQGLPSEAGKAMRAEEGPQAQQDPGLIPRNHFAGGHRIRVTPVPIPNTEVKPDTADGTAWETVWESRSLPALLPEARDENSSRAFFISRPTYDRVTR